MDLSAETAAYAAYRNGLARAEAELEPEEFVLYLEDLAKARAAVEVAWLERAAGNDKPAALRHGGASPSANSGPTVEPAEKVGWTTSTDPPW